MGAKWLNYFRWEYDSETFILFDEEGNKTKAFYQYANLCSYIKVLSPYLTTLTSTDIKVIQGYHKENKLVCKNSLPKTVTPINWDLDH
jgi:hypothetical protein